jgi:hypothetical protein
VISHQKICLDVSRSINMRGIDFYNCCKRISSIWTALGIWLRRSPSLLFRSTNHHQSILVSTMSLERSIWTTTFWLVMLAIAAADLAMAEPQANPTTTAPSSPSSSSNQACFQGDNNTYGLGVRIGVYAQWIGSVLSYLYVPDEARGMAGVNLVFTLSNFAGATPISQSRRPSSTDHVPLLQVSSTSRSLWPVLEPLPLNVGSCCHSV